MTLVIIVAMEVSKSELKRKMLAYLRQVERSGEPLIVTDRGRAVVQIVPIAQTRTVEQVFGPWRDRVIFHEDPVASTIEEWPET